MTKRWVNEAQEAVNSDNIMVQVRERCRRIVFLNFVMIIIKVFIKLKILSIGTVLSTYTHTHAHTQALARTS